MTSRLQPVAGIARNPLLGLRPGDMVRIPVGVTIASQAPDPEGGLLICRLNGEILLRPYWTELTQPGDFVEWHVHPQGRETIRVLLQIAIVASLLVTPLNFLTPYLIAANIAYNLLVPPRLQDPARQAPAAGSIFSTSLAGNAARLDQPIWKNCGRIKITPPFAASPYGIFAPKDPTDPDGDSDQFYYAIFALGVGNHTVERTLIGKTSIKHFADVVVRDYLAPGVAPSRAAANIVVSAEVSQLELTSGLYVGGFAACRPGDTVVSVGIDTGCSQGLGKGADPLTVEWQVEAREINDFGAPIGDWQILGVQDKTRATNTPPRWSKQWPLVRPMRCEVRLIRNDTKDTDPSARHSLEWIGLRATLSRAAPLNPDTAHFEVVMRASDQLSQETQRDFSMILRSHCRTYALEGSPLGWQPEVFTRNAAWWMLELLSSTTWGMGIPDERIDFAAFVDLATVFRLRQDRFDYCFASGTDSWSALQLIAHAVRCRVFRRNGVYTVARDALIDLPTAAITPRIAMPDSMKLTTTLPKREQADGYVVQYLSNITWDTAQEECPCPGVSTIDTTSPFYNALLPAMANPIYIRLDGVTGRTHARREGIYQAASLAYRQSVTSAKIEMEGVLLSFMDPVRWQPLIHGYGQSGDVVSYAGIEVGLSEPADFSGGPTYLTLIRDDGTLTDPVLVSPGGDARIVILPHVPDFVVVADDATRERTRYLLGPADADELIKVTSIRDGGRDDGGAQLFDVEGLVDDDRVHAADNALLPTLGETQDPIDDGAEDDPAAGIQARAVLTYHQISDNLSFDRRVTWTFSATGVLSWDIYDTALLVDQASGSYSGQWANRVLDPLDAANWEIKFTDGGMSRPDLVTISGGFGTWLNLITDRTVVVNSSSATVSGGSMVWMVDVSIRRVGSIVPQATGTLVVSLGADFTTGDGGDAGVDGETGISGDDGDDGDGGVGDAAGGDGGTSGGDG